MRYVRGPSRGKRLRIEEQQTSEELHHYVKTSDDIWDHDNNHQPIEDSSKGLGALRRLLDGIHNQLCNDFAERNPKKRSSGCEHRRNLPQQMLDRRGELKVPGGTVQSPKNDRTYYGSKRQVIYKYINVRATNGMVGNQMIPADPGIKMRPGNREPAQLLPGGAPGRRDVHPRPDVLRFVPQENVGDEVAECKRNDGDLELRRRKAGGSAGYDLHEHADHLNECKPFDEDIAFASVV